MATKNSKRNDGIERRVKADGSISYRVLIRRTNAQTISKTFKTYQDARTYRQRIDSDFSKARAIGQSPLSLKKTFGDALDRYERDVMPGHRSQSSEKAFLKYWRDKLEAVRLSELAVVLPDQVEALAKAKGTGSTANRYLGFLRRVVGKAKAWRWIDRNPAMDIDLFPEGRPRERVVKAGEMQSLLEVCDELATKAPEGSPARQLRNFLTLLYGTACRKSEVRFLRWEDVDLEASTRRQDLGEGMGIALLYGADTKNQTPREVVLLPEVVELLTQHRDQFKKPDHPWVFPGRSRFCPASFDRYFIEAREAAGIVPDRRGEQLVMHSLRHSAASEMGDGGATEYQIMAAGGWKSPSVVKRYVKTSTAQAVAALQKRRAK